jgi:two-component system sensor histidine kinase MtrB
MVEADRVRLERIVRNLVLNAVSYGQAGGDVVIAVEPTSSGRPTAGLGAGIGPGRLPELLPAGVAVRVTDDGPGLPDQPERVFDRFWRADPSRARDTGGAGLGLAIAAEDVGLHGGFLRARDNPGGGAVFTAWLPQSRDG